MHPPHTRSASLRDSPVSVGHSRPPGTAVPLSRMLDGSVIPHGHVSQTKVPKRRAGPGSFAREDGPPRDGWDRLCQRRPGCRFSFALSHVCTKLPNEGSPRFGPSGREDVFEARPGPASVSACLAGGHRLRAAVPCSPSHARCEPPSRPSIPRPTPRALRGAWPSPGHGRTRLQARRALPRPRQRLAACLAGLGQAASLLSPVGRARWDAGHGRFRTTPHLNTASASTSSLCL